MIDVFKVENKGNVDYPLMVIDKNYNVEIGKGVTEAQLQKAIDSAGKNSEMWRLPLIALFRLANAKK